MGDGRSKDHIGKGHHHAAVHHAAAVQVFGANIEDEVMWTEGRAIEPAEDRAHPGVEALLENGLVSVWNRGGDVLLFGHELWSNQVAGQNLCGASGGMRQVTREISVETGGKGLCEVTGAVRSFVAHSGISNGLLTVFIRHTSASLTIQENADPSVLHDLEDFLGRLAPEDHSYAHASEGPDDMPAHIKAALTDVSLCVPVVDGDMALGTWQGIFVMEHRARGHLRKLRLLLMGD